MDAAVIQNHSCHSLKIIYWINIKEEKMKMKSKLVEALKGSIVGGIVGGVISGLLNYFVLPVPETKLDNAIGHGIGGLICTFIGGVVGILGFMIKHKITANSRDIKR